MQDTRRHAQDTASPGREYVPQNVRRRIYLIATAIMPLLVFYGIVSDSAAPLWLSLANAALVAPLAAAHTPKVDTP